MSPARRSALHALAFVVLWSAVETIAGGVLRAYSPYQVVFTRYVVHLALAAALWARGDPASLLRTRRPGYQLVRSLLMLVMPASWVMAGERGVPIDTTLAVFWLSPLLILLFARLALGERSPRSAWILAAIASAGAIALHRPRELPPLALLPLPLAMGVSFSLYVAMTRALRSEPLRANLTHTALWVALPLSFAMPRLWTTPSPRDLAVMIAIGVLGFATLWALDRMAAAAPLAAAAPVVALQAPIALAMVALLGGDLPGPRRALAVLLVVAAAAWIWIRQPSPAVT